MILTVRWSEVSFLLLQIAYAGNHRCLGLCVGCAVGRCQGLQNDWPARADEYRLRRLSYGVWREVRSRVGQIVSFGKKKLSTEAVQLSRKAYICRNH